MERIDESTLDELARLKLEGESYSEIRTRLFQSGHSDEEVRDAMRKIDEKVLRAEVEQGNTEKSKQWYRAGLLVAVAGLVLAITYNAGVILSGYSRILVYSPFFAGILIMFYGRMLQGKKSRPSQKGPGRIRSKRPYK